MLESMAALHVHFAEAAALMVASQCHLGDMRSLYQTHYMVENLGMVTSSRMHGIGGCKAGTFSDPTAFAANSDGGALATLAYDFNGFTKKFAIAD